MFKVSLTESLFEEVEQEPLVSREANPYSINRLAIPQQTGIGFIIIDPLRKTLFFNKEAWAILNKIKEVVPGPDFIKSLPSAVHQAILFKPNNVSPAQKETFKSGRRLYSVWTVPLFEPEGRFNSSSSKQRMVILERISNSDHNLPLLSRKFKFTPRESHVVKLLLRGRSDKLIGRALGISTETVREHMRNIRSKMGAASRLEVVSFLLSA